MMQNTGLALEITLNTKSRYIKIYGKKMLEQKVKEQEKIFKDKYKPTKEEEEFF